MAPHNDIVLFHYQFSPFAKRVVWYLTLRGIEYAQCLQPVYLPREDINALGVKYRRIPIMSIGRDIYCDTRLILQKLEEKFPNGTLGASQPEQKAIEKLLESWTVDGGMFTRAAQTIPSEMPLLKDPKFTKDREDYSGRSWSQQDVKDLQPEGITHVRDGFEFLEKGLLADGRQWILKTEKPSLADIEGQSTSYDGMGDSITDVWYDSSHLAIPLGPQLEVPSTNSRLERETPQSVCLDRSIQSCNRIC